MSPMAQAIEVYARAYSLGVRFARTADGLTYTAPDGVMTEQRVRRIDELRDELDRIQAGIDRKRWTTRADPRGGASVVEGERMPVELLEALNQ